MSVQDLVFPVAPPKNSFLTDLTFPPAPAGLGIPEPEPKPSREELLRRLKEKRQSAPGHRGQRGSAKSMPQNIAALSAQLAEYTKMDESVIKNMIQETGVKKMAKNPLKFARKVAEALPGVKS